MSREHVTTCEENPSANRSHLTLRLSFGVKELDAQVSRYLKARLKAEATYGHESPAELQARIGQVILDQPGSLLEKEVRLGFAGMSLADFALEGYNDTQVARDSDGHQP